MQWVLTMIDWWDVKSFTMQFNPKNLLAQFKQFNSFKIKKFSLIQLNSLYKHALSKFIIFG